MNRIEEINAEITALEVEKIAIKKRKLVTCAKCKKRTTVGKLIIFNEEWYVSPYGCTGGDYWNTSKRYEFFCPKCEALNDFKLGDIRFHCKELIYFRADETYPSPPRNTQMLELFRRKQKEGGGKA